ncbi:hypothetical protein CCICO_08395 [Corynebacterium ciconiae DSM 44920]|uniref:DUF7768 domain-containing protein n=1 Tax=Corynebacterium ciconiae TaxID=227319 RepID=UPI000373D0D1|nr:hypothetical protein [Corynebacterium ciconiae]WKD61692.1 hypothetical protein CCICO_08395 [Corynebacterium ciconiae DSM 44920]
MNTLLLDPELDFSPRNTEGSPAPTAYEALTSLQRAQYGYRPLVYVYPPYSDGIAANVELARAFCAHAVTRRNIPLAPHLYYSLFMDDNDPADRKLVVFTGRILLSRPEATWVYTDRAAVGMRAEISWAHHLDLPIKYFDVDFEEFTP